MSESTFSEDKLANASRDEIMSALFSYLVVQQSNMALMLLGKVPHPESGETMKDIEAAKMFIDQLEMIEHKTRGNLSKEEDKLIKQSLMTLRMAFVEAIEQGEAPAADQGSDVSADGGVKADQPASVEPGANEGEESKKRFTKKY